MSSKSDKVVDEIQKDYNNAKTELIQIQRLFQFVSGDQWRTKNWMPIDVKGLPKRVHNKIITYIKALTSYFIQNYPEVKLNNIPAEYRVVEAEINRLLQIPYNANQIAKAVGFSLVAGYSVVRMGITQKGFKVDFVYPFQFYPENGSLDLQTAGYVVERYIARNDRPLLPIPTSVFQQYYSSNKEKFSIFTKIHYREKDKMRLVVLKSDYGELVGDIRGEVVLEEELTTAVFPYAIITQDPFIGTVYDYQLSEVSQARDTQVMINKIVSYSDIVMGLASLGIVKARNMQPNQIELYPGVIIPVPEYSDIVIDRGIGLNFNFEAYNISSALIDDIFGMNEILRGIRPANISSGAGLQQMYNIALSRLQIKVPSFRQFFQTLTEYISEILDVLVERQIVNVQEDIALKFMEDSRNYTPDITPVFSALRRDEEIVDTVIRFTNAGVFPPQIAMNVILDKYKHLFLSKTELLVEKVSEALTINAGRIISKLVGLSNISIGGLAMEGTLVLSEADKKFLSAVGINPDEVTPDVLKMAKDILEDPDMKPQIQQMVQELVAKGYQQADAQAMVVVTIIKSILDALKGQQTTPRQPAPQG
ncbi:MAG: hypothetical protein ABDH28_00065 [Brevinematia bacterium]